MTEQEHGAISKKIFCLTTENFKERNISKSPHWMYEDPVVLEVGGLIPISEILLPRTEQAALRRTPIDANGKTP